MAATNVCSGFAKGLGWQEKSDHTMRVQSPATNWYGRSLQLPHAPYCLGVTSSSLPFSRPPLKNGNTTERSRRRNVSTSRWAAGLSACARCGTPKGCGYRGGEGPAHLIVPSCLRWRISSLSCQCSDCMWRRGRGCVATSEKISCLYFIFCSCSTFFSPHHPPPCEWYVWTISFKTSFLSRLDG